ncbi:bifunctional helix-turn-helix transcriptional regulator/GNAT family N-acetyltransferase [Chitinophaga nivalis]|uniref:Helix-turn-helix domain-containing GNAT family N-acetyltransferase n=1 Tax=Chitinophaga nivalis TaxID=2991709 RepID=A0ABT3IMD6_9BACT|nr:helix-turn-helix domain-containing GNAT family N-acetyltransferase [Chitinophaga nivalis]MCW3465363.1 helix-turn-helix domain-containing GNAT family N-acetyltransferase [Chitinophaga nivalis]MCW3484945.1 helix-turn-helix domain-containing GNAT family N-acetyltransferase [Chitinophaga nivalis]
MLPDSQLVGDIRHFNRFYTNMIGLLNLQILDSNLSLSEVRVLYEIDHREKCTAGQLIAALQVDGGYLSRMLKKFEQEGWLLRQQSAADGRTFLLYLSAKGKKKMAALNEKSSADVQRMLTPLNTQQQQEVASSMKTIEQHLLTPAATPDIRFRYTLQPGDIGYLVHMHGSLYGQESGFNVVFEAYVCKTFYDFVPTYNPDKDRMILATLNDRIIGSVAIVNTSKHQAQLRWFLIDPSCRGQGLGKKLLQQAMDFCREKNYRKVHLMTADTQTTAIALYKREGFRKTTEKRHQQWGQELCEERYDVELA